LLAEIWLEWWTASNVDHPNNRLGYWIGVYAVFGFLAVFSLIAASWFVSIIDTSLPGLTGNRLMLCNMVKDSAESLHLKLVQTVERWVSFSDLESVSEQFF
jgi:hypothetical protein